jgi:iron complex transport system substrate-binding protein
MLIALLLCLLAQAAPARALEGATREITDMAGRKVTIPATISKVYGASPPANHLLYAVAPDLMAGLSLPISDSDKPFVRPGVARLPVLGGIFGRGRHFNPEEVLKAKPDFVLAWVEKHGNVANTEESFSRIGLPVVVVRLDTLSDYPATLTFLGDVLGRSERAKALADYIAAAIARVGAATSDISPEKRINVFYAETADGLTTECDQSFHVEPIRVAGGENVHHCRQSTRMGMEKISLEQIIAYQPELILVQDRRFAASVASNPTWRNVEAVKTGRITAIPRVPFNWLDRPPSFMRALGIQWLANLFYPDRFPLDLKAETKAFYKLFVGVDLTDSDVETILK